MPDLRREKIKEWVQSQKDDFKCAICGFDHNAALDFHHKNPTEKDFTISDAIKNKLSIKRIQEEMKKCVVLCANHHRLLEAGEIKLCPN